MSNFKPDNISPFPDNINRSTFGQWLSGFVDGEGCFLLHHSRTTNQSVVRFALQLRSDDWQVLKLIQSFWGCGKLFAAKDKSKSKPRTMFLVCSVDHLEKIVVPHFEEYPLFAKKSRDFMIWKQGVHLVYQISLRPRRAVSTGPKSIRGHMKTWTNAEKSDFISLCQSLKQQRRFETTETIQLPERKPVFQMPSLFAGLVE